MVLIAGAVLIPAAACIRSGQRMQLTPPSNPHASATAAAPALPSLWAQIHDALESWKDMSPITESMVPPADTPESVTIEFKGDLVIACPKDDDRDPRVQTWIAWRRQAIDALPESLRNDSDHQRAIDETYRQAIRGFLSEAVAVSYDPEELEIIIGRPPVGGYDISAVGFTDIDEQSEVTVRDGGRTRDFWEGLMAKAINDLPTELREGSQHRAAIEAYFQSVETTGISDYWNQIAAEAAAERRALVGFVTKSQAQQEVYDLRATPAIQTLMRWQYAAPDPPVDPHQQALDFWSDWKKQAIAALPESLRDDSEYRKAIDDHHDAAIQDIQAQQAAKEWDDLAAILVRKAN